MVKEFISCVSHILFHEFGNCLPQAALGAIDFFIHPILPSLNVKDIFSVDKK